MRREKIDIRSRCDGSEQPSFLHRPERPSGQPLLVWLHTWSGDLTQRNLEIERLVAERGWLLLYPNFRGRNDHPEACGSEAAQQDILDAVDHVVASHGADPERVFLAGASGGGHMTMLMAGRHPRAWRAASAWVGISDLADWHATHLNGEYGAMCRASCGGAPGDSAAVDAEYRARSPLTWLHQAAELALDLGAGIHDGHTGSVPIRHTLNAFNAIARARGEEPVSAAEMQQLSVPEGRLAAPGAGDLAEDPSFGRAIYLRRTAGPCRVSIFEGGHEELPQAVMAWFDRSA